MPVENEFVGRVALTGINDQDPKLDLDDVEKYTSLALIKKKSFAGYVYFFERRRDDDTFSKKLALFGGSRSKSDPEISHETILNKELEQELGLVNWQPGFVPKLYAKWRRESGSWTAIEVFTIEERFTKTIRSRRLKNAQKSRSKNHPEDKFGKLVKIRRVGLNWWWFRGWQRLTPIAAFALLADWNEDIKAAEATRK